MIQVLSEKKSTHAAREDPREPAPMATSPFPRAEWDLLQAQDRNAATVVVSLIAGILMFGLISSLITFFSALE
jgi:hypothetical protein